MEIQIILALAALGCCTGFLAGLLGIGGGMVLTPFLTLLLGYAGIPIEHIVHVAIATSMGTILFTSLSSVRAHAKRGAVLWNVVFSMAPGILVGAVVGAQVSGALPTFWVALIFAVFVYTSAAKMFLNAKPTPSRHLPGPAGMFGAGTAIGVISALVGAGGGVFCLSCPGATSKCITPLEHPLPLASPSRLPAPLAISSAAGI